MFQRYKAYPNRAEKVESASNPVKSIPICPAPEYCFSGSLRFGEAVLKFQVGVLFRRSGPFWGVWQEGVQQTGQWRRKANIHLNLMFWSQKQHKWGVPEIECGNFKLEGLGQICLGRGQRSCKPHFSRFLHAASHRAVFSHQAQEIAKWRFNS